MNHSPETLAAIANAAPHGWRHFFTFLLETGCRQGEAAALCWDCIDKEKQIVHFRPHRLPNGTHWRPKTPSGERAVCLSDTGFRRVFGGLRAGPPSGLVFFPDREKPPHRQTVKRQLIYAADRMLLPVPKSHDFRRARISQALGAGGSIAAVSRAVGHRSIWSTVRYLHNMPVLAELPPVEAPAQPNTQAAEILAAQKRGRWL